MFINSFSDLYCCHNNFRTWHARLYYGKFNEWICCLEYRSRFHFFKAAPTEFSLLSCDAEHERLASPWLLERKRHCSSIRLPNRAVRYNVTKRFNGLTKNPENPLVFIPLKPQKLAKFLPSWGFSCVWNLYCRKFLLIFRATAHHYALRRTRVAKKFVNVRNLLPPEIFWNRKLIRAKARQFPMNRNRHSKYS